MKERGSIKIMILTSTVKANSGWGRYSLETIDAIRNEGFNLTVVCNDGTGDLNVPGNKNAYDFFKSLIRIWFWSREYEIIHAYDGWPFGIYGYFAVLGTNKKLFINGVGTYSVAPLYRAVKGWLLKLAYKRAEEIYCISNYVKDRIDSLIKVNTKVVHLGLTKMEEVSGNAFLEKLDIPQDAYPVVITVGEIKKRKGQLDTFRALVALKEKYPKFLYLVVGASDPQGSYLKSIEELAKENDSEDNIKILNNVKSDGELAVLYQRSDLFALNSNTDNLEHHFEGFGLVILEANQFGVPAIGSRDSGIEDAIAPGVNGYLTNQGDSADIKEATVKVLSHGQDYWTSRTKEFANKFNWQTTARFYCSKYLS